MRIFFVCMWNINWNLALQNISQIHKSKGIIRCKMKYETGFELFLIYFTH